MRPLLFILALAAALPAPSAIGAEPPLTQLVAGDRQASPELKQVSAWAQEFVTRVREEFGITRVYIGGGGAIAILEHVYRGKPLNMRDLDLIVVADRKVDAALAERIGRRLETPALGTYSAKDLRPRPRAHPDASLPPAQRAKHVAGYGYYYLKNGETMDVSLYHSEADMRMNGLFDIDAVLLELTPERSLEQLVGIHMASKPYSRLLTEGLIDDPHGGWDAWRNGRLRLLGIERLSPDPALLSIRAIRSHAKLGIASLPPGLEEQMRALIAGSRGTVRSEVVRNLIKLMGDDAAASQLKMLERVEAIDFWSPELDERLSGLSHEEIRELLDRPPAGADATLPKPKARLKQLVFLMEPAERLPLIRDLAVTDPGLSERWVLESISEAYRTRLGIGSVFGLPGAEGLLARAATEVSFADEVERILRSAVLTEAQKRDLLYRAVLRRVPEGARLGTLAAMAPTRTEAEGERLLRIARERRKGFFSGVFNPFHSGHEDVSRHAIEQMVLDELTVIPTPATTHNEVPIAWDHRVRIARRGLHRVPEARVIPWEYREALERSTGEAIRKLKASGGSDAHWVHVMGADSLERFIERGFLAGTDHELFVMHRPGTAMPEIPQEHSDRVFRYMGETRGNYTERRRSSTLVRERVKAGQPIDDLVSKPVEEYIDQHQLYRVVALAICRKLGTGPKP